MKDGTIAVIAYVVVLSCLLCISGFVSQKLNYDKSETDGIVIASIFWPIAIFAIPTFYIANWIYSFGKWLATTNPMNRK